MRKDCIIIQRFFWHFLPNIHKPENLGDLKHEIFKVVSLSSQKVLPQLSHLYTVILLFFSEFI